MELCHHITCPILHSNIGMQKIVACSQSYLWCLLVSIVFGTVSSVYPTCFTKVCVPRFLQYVRMTYGVYTNVYACNGSCDMYIHVKLDVVMIRMAEVAVVDLTHAF